MLQWLFPKCSVIHSGNDIKLSNLRTISIIQYIHYSTAHVPVMFIVSVEDQDEDQMFYLVAAPFKPAINAVKNNDIFFKKY